jgi:hypothetical protein
MPVWFKLEFMMHYVELKRSLPVGATMPGLDKLRDVTVPTTGPGSRKYNTADLLWKTLYTKTMASVHKVAQTGFGEGTNELYDR